MPTNGYGLELPSSWLRKRRGGSGGFSRLYRSAGFGGGQLAGPVIWNNWVFQSGPQTIELDFEEGNLSDWTTTDVTGTGFTLTATAGSNRNSTYGMEAVAVNNGNTSDRAQGQKDFTAWANNVTVVDFDLYVSAFTASGFGSVIAKGVCRIGNDGVNGSTDATGRGLHLRWVGTRQLRAGYKAKDGTLVDMTTTVTLTAATWYKIRLKVDKTGANPAVSWSTSTDDGANWTLQDSATDSTSGTQGLGSTLNRVSAGIVHSGAFEPIACTVYIDNVIIADGEVTYGSGPSSYTRTLSSTVSHTAAIARAVSITRALNNSIARTDTVARSVAMIRTQSSSISRSETETRVVGFSRSSSSSISSVASVVRAGAFGRALSATVAHAASVVRAAGVARSIVSSVGRSDLVARAVSYGRALVASVSHSAAVQRAGTFIRALSSAIAHTVAVARSVAGGANISRDIASSISHSATVNRALAVVRTASSAISHSATVQRVGAFARLAATTVAHSTGVVRVTATARSVVSAVTRADLVTRSLTASRSIVSVVGRADAVARGVAYVRALASGAAHLAGVTRTGVFGRGLAWVAGHGSTMAGVVTGALSGVDSGRRRLTRSLGRASAQAWRVVTRAARGVTVLRSRGTGKTGSRTETEVDG